MKTVKVVRVKRNPSNKPTRPVISTFNSVYVNSDKAFTLVASGKAAPLGSTADMTESEAKHD